MSQKRFYDALRDLGEATGSRASEVRCRVYWEAIPEADNEVAIEAIRDLRISARKFPVLAEVLEAISERKSKKRAVNALPEPEAGKIDNNDWAEGKFHFWHRSENFKSWSRQNPENSMALVSAYDRWNLANWRRPTQCPVFAGKIGNPAAFGANSRIHAWAFGSGLDLWIKNNHPELFFVLDRDCGRENPLSENFLGDLRRAS